MSDDVTFDLAGKAAFVAGGTSGINLAIAERLALSGADVTVLSRDSAKVDAAVAQLRSVAPQVRIGGYCADVRDYDAVNAAIAEAAREIGPLDIVISGAAGNFVAPASKLSANAFRTVVEIDLFGTFHVFRAAYEQARKPGASFIAISAPQSSMPFWGQAHVCAAKAGVDMLVKALAFEWGEEGVRVNALVPGPIAETEGMSRLAANESMREAIERSVALRRFGTKTEVAAMAAFLASDAARYVTGGIMSCDGGQLLAGGGVMHPASLNR